MSNNSVRSGCLCVVRVSSRGKFALSAGFLMHSRLHRVPDSGGGSGNGGARTSQGGFYREGTSRPRNSGSALKSNGLGPGQSCRHGLGSPRGRVHRSHGRFYSGLADPTATGIPLELSGVLSGSGESGPVPSVSAFQPPPPPLSGTLWSL